ncbi:TraR/DksA family transcriptional regulator [uncultured Aquitalea sp.]|uniref:TraR/DksA family transcriptional regulator n=1 Tax=uncultured Aquitalea sp. TaxID=540272 RepID=UPI0025D3100B|nr:TraR/DksA family transcriptional regulator [uncultured Aquitalea sp.]
MTDVFDRAQELELRQREEALARQGARQKSGSGLSHCEDCGEPIPSKRRQAVPSCTRCFNCQNEHEERNAR